MQPNSLTPLLALNGQMIEPGQPGWADATQAFNLAIAQEPALVALPADEHDVIAIVNFAREHGMQVAPQRTGHNAEPLGAMDDVILVKTDALQGVEIDVERRIARVRSGSKWGDVVPRASELGRAASTTTTTRSCFGRCAAAAATSASSPRSSSACIRSRRSTPACSSSRGS